MKITNDTGYLSPTVKTNWDSTAKNAISKVVDKMLKTDMKPSFSMIVKGYLSPTVKTNWDSTAKNAISKVVDKMLKTDMKPSFSMIVKGEN
ncbi:hypothetical protein RRG08_018477 [Elysia crispata]|uniref:Uncharacterized protein n=1 Tax=Elysia crispata TaxID=231223 RepID=A0AAE0YTI0_9GAST|nr:hypothetical protein RRG08_018477 [Elysia crispata]